MLQIHSFLLVLTDLLNIRWDQTDYLSLLGGLGGGKHP